MLRYLFTMLSLITTAFSFGQMHWQNVDSLYGPLPKGVHVYFTVSSPDTGRFRAFYVEVDLKAKNLEVTTDTSSGRRLTPSQFYERNAKPVVVVNGTFFSFATNGNLNMVVQKGKLVSYNVQEVKTKRGDSTITRTVYPSAIGIGKNRKADVAWTRTDSASGEVYAIQDLSRSASGNYFTKNKSTGVTEKVGADPFKPWKVETAIGGGPVLVQNGEIMVTNNQEHKFSGKAINDKHPRTAMGYTEEQKLIILVVEGRNPEARGATLTEEAQILKDLGCVEALNLDGGGSSCLLVNGKETIRVSDKEGQRPVPAVLIVR